MAQEEALRVVPKKAAEAPSQETLAGSCGSAAVRAMSLPNDLPGHRQRLGPGEDHCEAKIEAPKRLEEAGEGEAQGQGGEAEDQEAGRRQRTQAESDRRLRGLLQGEKGAHIDPAGATTVCSGWARTIAPRKKFRLALVIFIA